MFGYCIRLAWLGVRRNPVLVALIVGAISVGVGTFMTTYNLYHVASGNPIPQKSDRLFHVRLDYMLPMDMPEFFGLPDDIPPHVTWLDATALHARAPALRQAASMPTGVSVSTADANDPPFTATARHSTPELFTMFEVPFRYGGAWSLAEETERAQVVVLTRALNERLFGGEDSVGRDLLLNELPFRIVGVLDGWEPVPRFYDLANGRYADVEDLWVPFSLVEPLESFPRGNVNCADEAEEPGHHHFLRSECGFASLWAELPDADAVAGFAAFVSAYIDAEREAGRFPKPDAGFAVDDVMTWMRKFDVVGEDAAVHVLAAGLFLLVCLVNTMALLLAKFLSRSTELGVRRALGATRGDLFLQHLIECALIGVVGGAFGLVLAWLGLRLMRTLFENTAKLAVMDPLVIVFAVIAAAAVSVLAGLYPAWRACIASPAAQIRSR